MSFPRSVDFDGSRAYVQNRPLVDLIVFAPGGRHLQVLNALVDTGADFTQLDLGVAHAIGLAPERRQSTLVATAGGPTRLYPIDLTIEVTGVRAPVRVLFGRRANPLLGRQGMLMLMQAVGFTTTDWLHQRY
ncbi:retroviral-like aspartic protease family protein [Streptomyces sp. NPDC049577]|uniref:retroviral-like aspartic protease family protein n=1 Tax=Streptomyces sp. NPDC049577 TaxID=3155153 RepID=UPI0034457D06